MYKVYPLVDGAIDTDKYFKYGVEVEAMEVFTDLVRDAEENATVETAIILVEDDNEDDDISENARVVAEHTVAR